jgi:hypothetical protein
VRIDPSNPRIEENRMIASNRSMSRTRGAGLAAAALLVPLLAGCPSPQTPYSFAATADSGSAVDAAARTVASEGWDVGKVDRQSGIVTSKWVAYASASTTTDTIFVHRITVTLAPAKEGSSVVVRMDVKNCPPGGYTVGDVEVQGTCQPVDGVFPGDQKTIDSIGAKLQAALGSTKNTGQ